MYHLFDTLTMIYKYKKLYEKRCQGIMKKYDLKIADIDVLNYVSHAGERNLSRDIADEGMSKANVSKAVEHLHRKGYVALLEDKEDRRCIHIELTEAAAPVISAIEMVRAELGSALAEGIADEDKEATFRVMEQLGKNMSHELLESERED